jgi:hypothetical protein
MATSAGTVQYEVVATVNEAITNMRLLQKETNTAVRQMAAELGGTLPKAANDAGKAHDSLSGKLKEFAQEQRQQGRMARFYASEVMSVIPAAEGSKGALTSLLGVLVEGAAGGLSLGLAFETVKFAIEQFAAASVEAARKAKEHHDQLVAITDAFEKYKVAASGASQTQLTFLDVTKKDREALFQAGKELDRINEKLAEMRKQSQVLAIGGLLGKREDLEKDISALRNRIDLARAAKEEADKASQAGGAPGASKKSFEDEQKAAEAKAQLDLKNYANELGMQADADAAKDRLSDGALQKDNARRQAQEQLNLQNYANELQMEANADAAKDRMADAALAKDNARIQQAAKEQSRTQGRQMRDLAQEAQRIGSEIGSVMADLATGTKDLGQAVSAVFAEVVQTVIRAAVAQVTANATVAASGAAASQAAIPVVGPVLAISAMGAMISAVMGLMSNMPSAAGGWAIPSGINPVIQAHGGEHVIPARIAKRYEDGAPSGGSGGGDRFVVQINTVDAASFENMLRRNSTGFVKVVRELTRNGRM